MQDGDDRKERRGGRRPGAGRKPTGCARVSYSVDLTPQQAALLREWGGGDVSAGLRWLVDAAAAVVGRGADPKGPVS